MNLWNAVNAGTHLLPGEAQKRRDRDREYLMSLTPVNLLRSHYLEAGLIQMQYRPDKIHWGWDSPMSQIRGTFCGHWLSAAAHMYRDTHDEELLARANYIVSEIARCQEANGGQWAFPIPEKYLYWLKAGRHPWAPQYVCHKNMMGLLDMYKLTGNQQALEIVLKCADWFYEFTNGITRENMDEMMDLEETGGILELWADLYGITRKPMHLEILHRYERPLLANGLLEGRDMLANMHANSTVPEMHGYARAYEVTGNEMYRKVVEAYWDQAVEKRGMYATGGQTSGEIWSPMGELRARLGDKNQEHCVVYNMMRLAEYLFSWTGDSKYADYWELNLHNGIYAQGFWQDERDQMIGGEREPLRETTTVTYYMPLMQGAHKHWGSKTDDFWCCHCSLVQANAVHHEHIYYQSDDSVALVQFIPSTSEMQVQGRKLRMELTANSQTGGEMMRDHAVNRTVVRRPHDIAYTLKICTDQPCGIPLLIRIPEWCEGNISISVNGEPASWEADGHGFAKVMHDWHEDTVSIRLGRRLRCYPLPDDPDMVAFVDGPVCLAGLVSEEHILYGDKEHPEDSLLCASDERQWQQWKTGWKTYHQPFGIEFKPLNEIGYETYTVYFPVEPRG